MGRKRKPSTVVNREKILVIATRLIKEKGVGNVSLSHIAQAVKISKGTLYYYYPSKSALIFDITEQSMNHLSAKILAWVEKSSHDASPQAILAVVFEAILKARTRGQIHLYLIQEALTDEALRARFSDEYARWQSMFRIGLEKLFPGRSDLDIMSLIMVSLVYGLLFQKLLGAQDLPLHDISAFITAAANASQPTNT